MFLHFGAPSALPTVIGVLLFMHHMQGGTLFYTIIYTEAWTEVQIDPFALLPLGANLLNQ